MRRFAGWSSDSRDVRIATTEEFLQLVTRGARLDDVDLVRRDEYEEIELRASLRGFPVRLAVSLDGRLSSIELRHRECKYTLPGLTLRYEREPDDDVDPGRREERVYLGEHVFVDYCEAKQAPAFESLPADLQARIVRELPRLAIYWLSSDDFSLTIHFRFHDSPTHRAYGVHRVVEAIELAVDVSAARGYAPPPPHLRAYAKSGVEDWADRLVRSIVSAVPGATRTDRDEDDCIDVTWIEDGVGVQLVLNHKSDELHAIALAPGVAAEFWLESDPANVRTAARLAPRVFVTASGITGTVKDARAGAALLRSLPPQLLTELVRAFDEHLATVQLHDELLRTQLFTISQISDGGTEAIRVAQLFARIAKALPRG